MQRTIKTLLGIIRAVAAFVQAQTLNSANKEAQDDLKSALNELSGIRSTIAAEKIPLIREVSSLEDNVRQKSATPALPSARQQRSKSPNKLKRSTHKTNMQLG